MDCATVEHYLGGGIAKYNFCSCSPVLELTRWLNTNMPWMLGTTRLDEVFFFHLQEMLIWSGSCCLISRWKMLFKCVECLVISYFSPPTCWILSASSHCSTTGVCFQAVVHHKVYFLEKTLFTFSHIWKHIPRLCVDLAHIPFFQTVSF